LFVKHEIKSIQKENLNLTAKIKNQAHKINTYQSELSNLDKIKKNYNEISDTVKKQEDIINSQVKLIEH